jgi:beta-phosphoglucomutase
MLRAIVFDFDGVLANSEPLHYVAFRDVLAEERVALTEADYYARYLGFDDVGVFRAVGEERAGGWSPNRVAELVGRKAGRLASLEQDVSVLFPGAAAAVRLAAAAVPIAIASGALGAEIRRVLDREQLTACFSAIVAAEDTPRSKPAPDPYLRAVSLLSSRVEPPLHARDCVALEDSQWGLQSAHAAGLRTVAVAHTYPAYALTADLVIDRVDELDLHALSQLCAD